MGDFAQNGFVTTLHNFRTKSVQQFEEELKTFSGYRPMELILPSLYSELEGPALKNIVEQISQVDYISHVIIGLDKASSKREHIELIDLKKISGTLLMPCLEEDGKTFRCYGE